MYIKLSLLGAIAAFALSIQCAATGFGPDGSLFASAKIGVQAATDGALTGTKTGKECVSSYFGLVSMGDASMTTVTVKADITQVKTIDIETFQILGLYSELCTVVTGD